MFFLNLSFRHKIPLWGSILILISAVMFSLSFGILAYDYLKQNHINNTISHGQSLINTIYTAFMHDDIWSAFNLINRSDNPPSTNTHSSYPKTYIETLVIFNSEQRVFASNKPENYPILANVEQLDFISPRTKQQIKENINTSPIIMQEESKRTIIILPIIANDNVLGHLLMINNETLYRSHFYILIFKAVLTTTIFVLCILLPINWYWGQRMAKPLVYLTEQISVLHKHLPDTIATHHYHYNDELGQLFKSYALMVDALKEKAFLEKQILQSERMAAIGRLSAELAHEINNPLAGMLMAIDTLKQHGSLDALSEKTISLLARGLNQIKESVAAILVEAKVQSHDLSPQDIEDVHQLVIKKANLTMIKIVFTNQLKQAIKLPSTPLRPSHAQSVT